jgi:hypothetical protein
MNKQTKSKHTSLRLPAGILEKVTSHSVAQRATLSHTLRLLVEDGLSNNIPQPGWVRINLPADVATALREKSAHCGMPEADLIEWILKEYFDMV